MAKVLKNNFIYYLILSIFIWSISLVIDKLLFTYFAAIFGIFITFLLIKKYFEQEINPFGLLNIGSIFLIFTINMGWVLSGLFIFINYKINLFDFFDNYLFLNYRNYLYANVYTLLFCLILYLLSLNEKLLKRENSLNQSIKKFNEIDISQLKYLAIIIIILEAILFYNGFIDYRGYANERYQAGIISWYVPYLDFIFHFQISITSLLIFNLLKTKFLFKNFIIILISVIFFSIIFFSRGRYQFFF